MNRFRQATAGSVWDRLICAVRWRKANFIPQWKRIHQGADLENTYFVVDRNRDNIYMIAIDDNYLSIRGIQNIEKKFRVDSFHEEIIDVSYDYGILFVKTVEELCNCSQKKRLYLMDLSTNKIWKIRDTKMIESYHMPYILNCNGNINILIEDVQIFPYELYELETGKKSRFGSNEVLTVPINKLVQAEEGNERISWKKLTLFDKLNLDYIQVLDVQDDMAIIAGADEKKNCTHISWVYVENEVVKDEVIINSKITETIKKMTL